MEYFPLYHDFRNRRCLIVGAGDVALRKALLLLRSGAELLVIAPRVDRRLLEMSRSEKLQLVLKTFDSCDLTGMSLVVAATNDVETNSRVSREAMALNIPVNVVDQPDLCSCVFPSIIDRSPVLVAISSSARSPTLSRSLREKIERLLPGRTGQLADFLASIKSRVRSGIPASRRRHFYEAIIEGPVAEAVLAGSERRADDLFSELLENYINDNPVNLGEVYLVGAGPGDPDLLTLRALRLMQKADVCLYDNLVSPQVIEMVRRDARREYVGKQRSAHSMSQEAINDKLVRLALGGERVLRLKGGDPFIFGRGGEEIEKLAVAGIPFQVVPGITAATGCACYAGIPLTHRDYSQSVRFVTGHLQSDGVELPWHELVAENQTIVVYMGLAHLDEICHQLVEHGRAKNTPVALISRGTTPQQQIYTGTLATLPGIISREQVHAPTLIIIGEVVKLRNSLLISE